MSSQTESPQTQSSKSLLSSLSQLFHKKSAEESTVHTQPQQFKQHADELNSALSQLKAKIESRRAQAVRTTSSSSAGDGSAKASGFKLKVSSPEELKRELEDSQKRLNQTIVALHKQLGTGINETRLSDLQARCIEILESISATETDAKIRKGIIEKLFKEIGAPSWQILNQLMQRQNIKWDLPESISANLSEDETERNIQSRMGELEDLFINQSITQGTEVLGAVISAWKRYPDEKSWLWKEVSLRAVGTGIRAVLLLEAVERIRAEAPKLRSTAEELMQENIAKVDAMLQSGLQSIEQAEVLVSNGDRIIREIIPELAWDMVDEFVQKRAAEMIEKQ